VHEVTRRRTALGVLLVALAAAPALADWLQPDPSYRDAQFLLRAAQRDTLGHADDPLRLDTLGVALLRLGHTADASRIFRRVLEQRPSDVAANAGLGKLALFADRLPAAESLLNVAMAAGREPDVVADLYATRLRQNRWKQAAELAVDAQDPGRAPLLERFAERAPYQITRGPETARIPWARTYPVPLVRVKLNGESMLMALDTGSSDLLLDEWAARRARIEMMPSQSKVFWTGTRLGVQNAVLQKLELGSYTIEQLPAGVTSLGKWSLHVNPQAEPVAGVIGLQFLRAFTPTFDYPKRTLVLRKPGVAWTTDPGAKRIPFEIWGESELTVYGNLAGGRRMALVVQSGVPECGVGSTADVFAELGVKPGSLSKLVTGLGTFLQGRPWQRVAVPAVTVGPLTRNNVPGWSGALDAAELWRHGVRRDGILSHDFFKSYAVTYDWAAHEMVVEEH
jgi:hypothetical protein